MPAIDVERPPIQTPSDDSLEPRVIQLVSSVGAALDEMSVDLVALPQSSEPGPAAAVALAYLDRLALAELPQTTFSEGAGDACQQVTVRFAARATGRQQLRVSLSDKASARLDTFSRSLCADIAVHLADYRIASALVHLATVKPDLERGNARYRQGVHYAMKRSVSGYRGALERRANSFLGVESPTREEKSAGALLYIALTGSSLIRAQAQLGDQFGATLEWLDGRDYVQCADGRPKPAMYVTQAGATWLRERVARRQIAAAGSPVE